MTSTANLPAW
jgi:hypothetical protein